MKNVVKVILIILIGLIVVGTIFFLIDYNRVQKEERPIFCISNPAGIYTDGGTVEYFGLGYKIIDFNMLNGYDEMKIGSWFMKYEDFSEEYNKFNNNTIATLKAVIIEVNNNSLSVMGINNSEGLNGIYTVGFTKEGNIGFKEGQEILIYFDGMILETFPGQINDAQKIEITKEKSDTNIPDDVIRFFNNKSDKVDVNISELTNKGVTININDENELPYEYTNDYIMYKEVKNEEYTGVGNKIGEDTENSISGYTGTGLEYIWEELEQKQNVNLKNTIEDLIYNLPDTKEDENVGIIGKKIDWTSVYGSLDDGKYRFIFSNSGSFPIAIEFLINNEKAERINIQKGF